MITDQTAGMQANAVNLWASVNVYFRISNVMSYPLLIFFLNRVKDQTFMIYIRAEFILLFDWLNTNLNYYF